MGSFEKVCQLHNGIFYLIQLCHTLSILLYHFPCVIHQTSLRNNRMREKKRLFFAYMAVSAYHFVLKEVESHIFRYNLVNF